MSPNSPDFSAFPAEGAQHDLGHVRPGWTASVRVVPGAMLQLPSGRVVACEPSSYAADEPAFDVRAEPGAYRVELIVADISDSGTYVYSTNAAARVVIRDERVATWQAAVPEGAQQGTASDDDIWCYPVDGGTGCFASPEALAALARDDSAPDPATLDLSPKASAALDGVRTELSEDDGSMDPGRALGLRMMVAALGESAKLNLPHTPGEVSEWTDRSDGANIVSFTSGDGDGRYGTRVGYTAAGELGCFVTDFGILTGD